MPYRLHYDNNKRIETKEYPTAGAAMKAAKRKITEPGQTASLVAVVDYDASHGPIPVAIRTYYNYSNLGAKLRATPVMPTARAIREKAQDRVQFLARAVEQARSLRGDYSHAEALSQAAQRRDEEEQNGNAAEVEFWHEVTDALEAI